MHNSQLLIIYFFKIMKKQTIKCGIAAAVVVAAGFAAYQSYGAYGAQDNSLLMQNIEALAQSTEPEGDPSGDPNSMVPNGYILKGEPRTKKTCYHAKCNGRIEDWREIVDGKEIAFAQYEWIYVSYNRYDCEEYKISEHQYLDWWPDCSEKAKAECDKNDKNSKPEKMKWTQVDYNDGHIVGSAPQK